MNTYLQDYIDGIIKYDDIDDYIDKWHDSESILPLHEYLGITEGEYTLFVMDYQSLQRTVDLYKEHYEQESNKGNVQE